MKRNESKKAVWRQGLGTIAILLVLAAVVLALPGTVRSPRTTVGAAGDYDLFLPLVISSSAANTWSGEYYSNKDLYGTPAFETRREPAVDHDWGAAAPPGLPSSDFFSVRWTATCTFEAGTYTFFVYADDGVRLWLDGQLLIDAWTVGAGNRYKAVSVTPAGEHVLTLEYYENTGNAAIRLNWRRTDLAPQWTGDYFNTLYPAYPAHHQETNSSIQFDWGAGAPLGIDPTDFSVSWKASPTLEAGTYRAYVTADDGFQLWLDGALLMDGGWNLPRGFPFDNKKDFTIAQAGTHQVTLNYLERSGSAEARLLILPYPLWTAEYYKNTTLSGTPYLYGYGSVPFHDWGTGAPTGLPADGFSIRWTGQRYFHAGAYRFGTYSDDGVRVYVDGKLLIDAWESGLGTHFAPVTFLDSGNHEVTVEYFELAGGAEIRFWWE